jgi:dUTP pyrophosphatase
MALVPVGVWIEEWTNELYDIQIRAKSSLFSKTGCMLANGVGTIDCDYRDEIQVMLYNTRDEPCPISNGQSIAQIVLGQSGRFLDFAMIDKSREGGFGSTGE